MKSFKDFSLNENKTKQNKKIASKIINKHKVLFKRLEDA